MSAARKKLTDEAVKRLGEAWAAGATDRIAAGYAGVGYTTLNVWIAAAKAGDPECRRVLDARDVHTARSAMAALRVVGAAAEDGQWQAAAWLLERRFHYIRPTAPEPELPDAQVGDIAARAVATMRKLGLIPKEETTEE